MVADAGAQQVAEEERAGGRFRGGGGPGSQRRQYAFKHFAAFLGPGVHAFLIGQDCDSFEKPGA